MFLNDEITCTNWVTRPRQRRLCRRQVLTPACYLGSLPGVKPFEDHGPIDDHARRHTVIISGSFRPDYSYQENIWAEKLSQQGHRVTVVTAGKANRGPIANGNYDVLWLKTMGVHGRNLYFEWRVGGAVAGLRPDRILWFGPPQLFGRSCLSHPDLADIPMAVFMGQNSQMHPFDWRSSGLTVRERATALTYRLIRARTVVRACRRANIIVASTPETKGILNMFFPVGDKDALNNKMLTCPLGFDGETFFFDELWDALFRVSRS